jgi:DNA primase
VVFALRDRHHRVTGFYGRSTLPGAKVPHRFCAGNRTGLFYVEAARGASTVHLVEGVLDALALMQAGFRRQWLWVARKA